MVQELAKRRIAYAEGEGEVAALLRQMDLPEQHPIEGLLEVVRHSGGMFRLLGFLCAKLKLEPGEIGIAVNEETGDVTKYTKDDALHGYDHKSDQAPHVLLVLYKQWAETYARACKLALDANIDERLVRNAEHTSHAMFTAVTRAIAESDMDAETATRFSKALAGQLRALMDPFADVGGSNGQGQQEARQASARNRQGIEAARPRKKVRRTKRHTEA